MALWPLLFVCSGLAFNIPDIKPMNANDHNSSAQYARTVAEVAGQIQSARRVLVITGAGISADSGLPTYRGIGGLYDQDLTEDAIPIEDALSGDMLRKAPEVTWKYIGQIESACRGARPNPAHAALAQLEAHCDSLCVLTQNVDGFHRDAGSRDVIEMHGNIHELHCMACDYELWVADYAALESLPPRCPQCAHMLRPRVVLFGEMLPDAALARYYAVLDAGVDMVISVGTTAVFPYIAAPVMQAARVGLPTVDINPGHSEISALVEHHLAERAAVALPDICQALHG